MMNVFVSTIRFVPEGERPETRTLAALGFHQSPLLSHLCLPVFFPTGARYFPSGFHQSPRLVHTVLLLVSNPHVLIYNGHQLYVHFFLVQLCPSIFSCFLCTTAYFTLWRRCFPLGFHQSPRSSHLCLLAFPTPA